MNSSMSTAARCIFFSCGIIAALVVYGLLQEKIMTKPYDGEVFKDSVYLVFCNRCAAIVMAVILAMSQGETLGNGAPLWKYLIVSLSNVYASTCQYESLKYVSFAVQMLGKSFKMMPVMIWGMAISGKRYSLLDWCIALGVTAGVTEFLMTGPTAAATDTGNSLGGLLWLAAFLALDGLTSTMQERLFKEHKTTKFNQMLWVNLLSAAVSIVTMALSGTLFPALNFTFSHSTFARDNVLLSASAVVGQFFILSQVKEFGALVFAATMNVRQVVSILVSYVAYHHFITPMQVVGLALVFFALFYKSATGFFSSTAGERQPLVKKDEAAQEGEEARLPAGKV